MTAANERRLRVAALIYLAGLVVHNADHARRGLAAVPDGVVWAGTLLLVVAAVALTLVATGHRLAPSAATAVGLATAVGVSASHLLPAWGPLSDPLPGGDVDVLTWLAVMGEVIGGAALGLTGLAIVHRAGYAVAGAGRARPAG